MKRACGISFAEHTRRLDPTQYIYREHVGAFREAIAEKDTRLRYADLAAAVFAKLYACGALHKSVFSFVLDSCRDVILDMGFEESNTYGLQAQLHQNPHENHEGVRNVVMVAGCQNDIMLNRRIDKAVEFVSSLNAHCEMVFSGGKPATSPGAKVSIPNEALRMENLFREKLRNAKANAELPKMHRISGENISSTTATNIAELFNGTLLPDKALFSLTIVSSTFHLIRLAQAVLTQLTITHKSNLRHLALVGAEDSSTFFTINESIYFKVAMVDIYEFLLSQHISKPD